MDLIIINYYFDLFGERHWFVEYDQAVWKYMNLTNIEEKEIPPSTVRHIVKKYIF